MPEPIGPENFQTSRPASAQAVTPPTTQVDRADDGAPTSEFGSLRPYPTNAYSTTELPPRSPVAELVAGAIVGGGIGFLFGLSTSIGGAFSGALVFSIAGMLAGLWVGFLDGRAGFLSWRTVGLNVLRIPALTVISVCLPYMAIRLARQRDLDNR
jgi:multisubunit Na+/H+ antiporter MnhB subunit